MFRTLIRLYRSIFKAKARKTSSAEGASAAKDGGQKTAKPFDRGAESPLQDLLEDLERGKFGSRAFVLDLSNIREKMGSAWDSYDNAVHRIVSGAIAHHLNDKGRYARSGDEYLIALDEPSRNKASKEFQRISNAISELLFGTGANEKIQIRGSQRRFNRENRKSRRGEGNRFRRAFVRVKGLFRSPRSETPPSQRSIPPSSVPAKGEAIRSNLPVRRAPVRGGNGSAKGGSQSAGPCSVDKSQPKATVAASAGPPVSPSSVRKDAAFQPQATKEKLPDARVSAAAPPSHNKMGNRDAETERSLNFHLQQKNIRVTRSTISVADAAWYRHHEGMRSAGSVTGVSVDAASEPHGFAPAQKNTPGGESFTGASRAPTQAEKSAGGHEPAAQNSTPSVPVDEPMSEKQISALERGIRNATERQERGMERLGFGDENDFPPPGLQFIYRPMWDVKGGSLSTCNCLPARLRGIDMLTGDEVLPDPTDLRLLALMDQSLILHAVADLVQRKNKKNLPLFSVPVHCSTLAETGSLQEYLGLCKTISQSICDRLIFCMVGIPSDVANAEIVSWLACLKPFGRLFLAQFTDPNVDLSPLRGSGVSAVGVDLTGQHRTEQEIIESFDKFVFMARQNGHLTFVKGLESTSLAVAAVGVGFNVLEGPVIMGTGDTEPPSVAPYGLLDLYAVAAPAVAENGG